MELDTKQKVLVAIYTEYQKDKPNMKETITANNLGIDIDVFKIALDKLDNEGLVSGLDFTRGGDDSIPRYVNVDYAKMTPYGIQYVETKLTIEKTLSAKEKVEKIVEESTKWGFEQLKDIAAKVLTEIAVKGISS